MKLILKAIINGLKAFTDTTSQDSRMSDPDFDPLGEMRTGKSATRVSEDRNQAAFEKLAALVREGEWSKRVNSGGENIYSNSWGFYFGTYPRYMKYKERFVEWLSYEQKGELCRIWEARVIRENQDRSNKTAAEQLSQFLGT